MKSLVSILFTCGSKLLNSLFEGLVSLLSNTENAAQVIFYIIIMSPVTPRNQIELHLGNIWVQFVLGEIK